MSAMKKTAKNKRTLLIVLLVAVVCGGVALAFWSSQRNITGTVTTDSKPEGEIIQEENPVTEIFPGDTVTKKVEIKNTGKVDMLVRVKLHEVWGSKRDGSGNVIEEADLKDENLQYQVNSQYWLDGKDGYYYYKGVVHPGEMTKLPVYNSYTIKEDTKGAYTGKIADLKVSADFLQVGGNAISSWGKTYSDLGITIDQPKEEKVYMDFISPNENFVFTGYNNDLLPNFKTMVPGESRVQTVEVKNSYKDPVYIYLRLQAVADPKNKDIQQMLEQFVTVKIADGNKVVFEGKMTGNKKIAFAAIKANQTKKLNITFTLDPKMGNKYHELLANVEWAFMAQDRPGSGDNFDDDNGNGNNNGNGGFGKGTGGFGAGTGDTVFILGFIILLIFTAIVLAVISKRRRDKQQ